jgi:hypothetical protein
VAFAAWAVRLTKGPTPASSGPEPAGQPSLRLLLRGGWLRPLMLSVSRCITHLFMFTKYEDSFDEIAADPARRRIAIADISRRRTIVGWCAVVMSICAIIPAGIPERCAEYLPRL